MTKKKKKTPEPKRANKAVLRRMLTQHLPAMERAILLPRKNDEYVACLEACTFVYYFESLEEAYNETEHPGWLFWLFDRLGIVCNESVSDGGKAGFERATTMRQAVPYSEVKAAIAAWYKENK